MVVFDFLVTDRKSGLKVVVWREIELGGYVCGLLPAHFVSGERIDMLAAVLIVARRNAEIGLAFR